MKKFILFILIVFIFPLRVNASSIVMDADTKRVLVNNAGDEKKLIASTTKILTAMVVINNVDIKKTVTIDENVLKSFGSGIYVEIGEKISVEDLLYGFIKLELFIPILFAKSFISIENPSIDPPT